MKKLFNKYREQILYIVFGGFTTVVSIGTFYLFTSIIPLDSLIANVISWILAVLFAFITNRLWVFKGSKEENFCKQMLSFYIGRLTTFIIEELILIVFVKVLHCNSMVIKLIAQVVIVILNYVISKIFIFKKKE